MFVSYSASIAKDKGFNGLDALIKDDMGNFKKIFPNLREIYRSADTMSLDYTNSEIRSKPHSEYSLYCVGFDGSVTGRTRAHNILFCDDLVKDIEEASNKDLMDKKWIEFTGTTRKRMQGNCKLLLNGTIFSINDPLSRTIQYYEENAPERLIRIRIPGLNEKDESNFNYKYGFAITTEMFHEDRNLMDPVSFSCLIQQNPIEREGLLFFEKEFKKFDLGSYNRVDGYERTVASCDVAWGGDDHLSMPVVDEYKNGDCNLIKWLFMKGSKEETMPKVVQYIIDYHVTYICFEANNGGDMYAEAVDKELKNRGYRDCYVTSKKSPTNKSKLDRILANQGFIKGSDSSDYKLIIPIRESIKEDKEFNEALNETFNFNQSTAKNIRSKQHDDSCFVGNTLISTLLGDKEIKDIKKGDKIITPFGIDEVEACGYTGDKEVIKKFGLIATKKHKVFNGKEFKPLDTLTMLSKSAIINLKELIIWKYQKLLYLMESSTNLWGREGITLASQIPIKEGKILKDFTLQFGNFITKKKFQKAIIFTIKMVILLITTFLTWNVYQLNNIFRKKLKRIGKMKNTEKKRLNILKKQQKRQKSDIVAKLEKNGIENTQKLQYLQHRNISISAKNVEKNILVQEKLEQNFVVKDVELNTETDYFVQKEKKNEKRKEKVYNLKTKKYGCYYANGILVSNCDSLAMLGSNVLGVQSTIGKAKSTISRDMLGI